MLYYLVVIGIINLGLGYALAVHLGHGPPSLYAAWLVLDSFSNSDVARPAVVAADVTANTTIGKDVAPAPEPPLPAVAIETASPEPAPVEEPISHVAMLDDSDAEEVFAQPAFEAYDDDAVELLRRDRSEAWETNAKYVETSIQNLNVAMMKSGVRAIELDNRLRACKGRTDAATIEDCLAQLKEDCQTYLDELNDATARFQGRIGESNELGKLGSASEMSSLDQAAQIETTLSNLDNMDFHSDLEAANSRLSDELEHLRVARHAWRDSQEAAFLGFARIENSIGAIEKQLHNDATTGLPNRIGLEFALDAWWREGRHQQQSIAALLLDFDGLGKLNRSHGALVGDAILYQVARHLRTTVDAAGLVGHTGGGSFLVVVPDCDPRAACATAELLRQSIEQIRFKQGENTLRITASVGVTVVRADEPDREPMLARLADSLKKAKHAGRNRAFFHNGGEPRQVEASPLAVEPLEITL